MMPKPILALLLAALAAPPVAADPPVPLFGRHKAAAVATPAADATPATVAPAVAPAPVDAAPSPAPTAATGTPAPPLRPADTPIGTVDVPPGTAAADAAGAPALPAAPTAAPALPVATAAAATPPAPPPPAEPVAASPAAVEAAGGATDLARLRAAYRFALPVYATMRARSLQLATTAALGGPGVNQLYARTTLADAGTRDAATPDNDTLVASAWLDLAGGPVILDAPALPTRYHSAALLDLFTNTVAIVGTRSGGKGGRYLIAGPGWSGTVPPGLSLLRSPTNDAWLLVRVLVNGPDDLPAATGLIRGFSLEVPAENAKPVPVEAVPTAVPDAATFLAVVDEALGRSPLPPALLARPEVAALGIAGDRVVPTVPPATLAAWDTALPALRAEVKGGLTDTGTVVDGWRYPDATIGQYGDTDDLARARVALGGLGMLPRTEAITLTATADAGGAPLTGAKAYTAHIPGHLPLTGFWSLTLYGRAADGRLVFVDTPAKRYSVGDRTEDLHPERDGGFDIFVQATAPSGERVVNWLPAPRGRFVLIFRAYLPGDAFLDGSFRLPPIAVSEVVP